MCGIAGAVFWDEPSVDATAIVRAMTDAQTHRGPDGAGVACVSSGESRGPTAVFGHRRLAIIDLTDRAAQPMRSEDGLTALTFNGEIYNFRELRRELEAFGRQFRSDSDVEVILQGYAQWGPNVVDRLRGMFAFAIWDGRSGELFLTRDRLGIKPLYTYRTDGAVFFASEVRALLASGLVPRRLDHASLGHFLRAQTVPTPRTLVAGVTMLEPGCYTRERQHQRRVTRYWDLLASAGDDGSMTSEAAARARLSELLAESTALHLVSDVPVGVFLSSGIDSVALAALVARQGITPRTFTVSFPGSALDEGPLARELARRLGASHVDIPLSADDCRSAVPGALAAIDHPSGDGINTFIVSQAVQQAGVKVALSGLGGDELFGGYPSFRRLRRIAQWARAWQWSPSGVRRTAAAATRRFGGRSPAVAKAAALLETDGGLANTFPLMRELFSADWRTELLPWAAAEASQEDPYSVLLSGALREHGDADLMTLISYAEARTYMHDVLLRDTDQMSMRHGLEVRVPLLDHRVAQYVMGLPGHIKSPVGLPKSFLVHSIDSDVVTSVAGRPKRGFVLPFDAWMRGELRDLCEHHLGPGGLGGGSVLNGDAVQAVWTSFLNNTGQTWSRPWALVALHAWMEKAAIQS